LPEKRFIVGGAMYPNPQEWPRNIRHFEHVVPAEHRCFYSSSPLTLNVTRGSMAAMGYCPSGRLFEAAACGTALLSDWWVGLDTFFEPGKEIFIATSTSDAIAVLRDDPERLRAVAERARERVLDSHTAEQRARRFLRLVEDPSSEMAELRQAACSGKEA
jgi:spore maturation protein CgeB